MELTAVILAGGQSSRFGRDKTMLVLSGQTLVERQLKLSRGFCSELIVVSNKIGKFAGDGHREILDNFPKAGPLAGIEAGLGQAKNQACLVLAADMPLVNSALIKCLIENFRPDEYDVLLPEAAGKIEPLCGIYKKDLAKIARSQLESGQRSVRSLLDLVNCQILPEAVLKQAVGDTEVFLNINRPEDHRRLLSILKQNQR